MHLRETLQAYQRNDPAARSKLEILLLYNGVHAILLYRLSHWLWKHHMQFLARAISQIAKWLTGVEIHPAATIGRRLVIDHGTGIVIGATTEIGDDCLIYQGVYTQLHRLSVNQDICLVHRRHSIFVGVNGEVLKFNVVSQRQAVPFHTDCLT